MTDSPPAVGAARGDVSKLVDAVAAGVGRRGRGPGRRRRSEAATTLVAGSGDGRGSTGVVAASRVLRGDGADRGCRRHATVLLGSRHGPHARQPDQRCKRYEKRFRADHDEPPICRELRLCNVGRTMVLSPWIRVVMHLQREHGREASDCGASVPAAGGSGSQPTARARVRWLRTTIGGPSSVRRRSRSRRSHRSTPRLPARWTPAVRVRRLRRHHGRHDADVHPCRGGPSRTRRCWSGAAQRHGC